MAEITASAYQNLRDYIQNNWKYIELRDDTNTPIFRIDTSDPRVTWTHTAGANPLELTCVISGSDTDITLPKTFASSAIYNVATGGDAFSIETFTPFTMTNTADQLIIKHQIQVPQI
ncbi:hypothetical protein [Desulfotomaculum nigrificans]|uniref:hypothetical protein n=1 Tax=Desulfotomaculum nigrificans TaxID=1565 RepID=UPI0001FAECE9|nr:hypothetical protein [Desulfotomaculum nigrificans]